MTPSSCLSIEGPCTITGHVRIEGAKNAALPCLVAALLTTEPVTLHRIPDVIDIHNLALILEDLGVDIAVNESTITLQARKITKTRPNDELVRRLRASFLVLGPLAVRQGRAQVAYPGGCAIGRRPVDQHLKGLAALGFNISVHDHSVDVDASDARAGHFRFDITTVTGTEHLMMTAAALSGTTILENCAREPEVSQLADMLNRMGAHIEGAGQDRIVIHGNPELGGCSLSIIPDRIEAGTYILAAVATRGHITLEPCVPEHLEALFSTLESYQPRVRRIGSERLEVDARNRPDGKPVHLITEPFPGFPTDLQAQLMVLMTQTPGSSSIRETVFPERFHHAFELNRMGARVEVHPPEAIVHGVTPLHGTDVAATDLRASASLVIAALLASGTTTIHHIHHLHRGYAHMESKLRALGVNLRSGEPITARVVSHSARAVQG